MKFQEPNPSKDRAMHDMREIILRLEMNFYIYSFFIFDSSIHILWHARINNTVLNIDTVSLIWRSKVKNTDIYASVEKLKLVRKPLIQNYFPHPLVS
jgi:hypothetical protein